MWQFVARTERSATTASDDEARSAVTENTAPSGPPVLALIRRLPLDDIDS
jgi:hypothetical protein